MEQEDGSLPSFEELMGRKENRDIYGRAETHVSVPPERDGQVLRQLDFTGRWVRQGV